VVVSGLVVALGRQYAPFMHPLGEALAAVCAAVDDDAQPTLDDGAGRALAEAATRIGVGDLDVDVVPHKEDGTLYVDIRWLDVRVNSLALDSGDSSPTWRQVPSGPVRAQSPANHPIWTAPAEIDAAQQLRAATDPELIRQLTGEVLQTTARNIAAWGVGVQLLALGAEFDGRRWLMAAPLAVPTDRSTGLFLAVDAGNWTYDENPEWLHLTPVETMYGTVLFASVLLHPGTRGSSAFTCRLTWALRETEASSRRSRLSPTSTS
jgi:hypothetical protein